MTVESSKSSGARQGDRMAGDPENPPNSMAAIDTRPTEPSSPEPARPSPRSTRPATDSIADGVRSRPTYAVSLDMFEGPLDLLLHLVRRHELDILDIPIAFITEKYIEYISFARSLDIEIAGEYLLMAATLAFLKSRELLPAVPGEDEESDEEEQGVDPREELIRRLIEYERFREAGDELGSRPLYGRDVFPRGGSPDVVLPEPGLAPVTLFRLAEAYNRVLDRAKIREEHTVVIEPVTVRQRMRQLSLLLADKPKLEFEALFLQQVWSSERELRQMLVVTLMSVLEMVKLGLLGIHQAQGSETLELERVVGVDEMSEAVSVFREEGEEDEPTPADAEPKTEAGAVSVAVEGTVVVEQSIEAEPGAVEAEQPIEVEPSAVEVEQTIEAAVEAEQPIEAEPTDVEAPVEAEASHKVEELPEAEAQAEAEGPFQANAPAEAEASIEVAAPSEAEAPAEAETPEPAAEIDEPAAPSEADSATGVAGTRDEPEAATAEPAEPEAAEPAEPVTAEPSEESGSPPVEIQAPDEGETE